MNREKTEINVTMKDGRNLVMPSPLVLTYAFLESINNENISNVSVKDGKLFFTNILLWFGEFKKSYLYPN